MLHVKASIFNVFEIGLFQFFWFIFSFIVGVLGIPFLDVVKVLAAILLLGNVRFVEGNGGCHATPSSETDIKSVASLIGVSHVSLQKGLTTRTRRVRGQLLKSPCDAQTVSPVPSQKLFSLNLPSSQNLYIYLTASKFETST